MSAVVIVTGASRGIGAATARRLGADGHAVCVNYRANAGAAAEVVAEVEAAGGRAIAVQADVAVEDDVKRLFAEVDDRLGVVTGLVNNAGVFGPRCRFEALSMADLRSVLDTNVLGLMHCTQEAARRMSRRHGGAGGAIVNVSSGSAYIGNPGVGVHYAVSKGAVNSFTIGISQELVAEGIRVNAVSPGLTRTDMPSAADLEQRAAALPMGRPGEPGEIAEAVAWLLSDAASYVAGANIRSPPSPRTSRTTSEARVQPWSKRTYRRFGALCRNRDAFTPMCRPMVSRISPRRESSSRSFTRRITSHSRAAKPAASERVVWTSTRADRVAAVIGLLPGGGWRWSCRVGRCARPTWVPGCGAGLSPRRL